MLYLYHKDAKANHISLTGDEHKYIYKVRRHKELDSISLRNLQDDFLYTYLIKSIDKHSVEIDLQSSLKDEVASKRSLHIAWCVIDTKNIEKILPSLNEMGVDEITFIYCKRSQKNFKVNFERLEKILINSSQQSGRSKMMRLSLAKDLKSFLEEHPNTKMLNFSTNKLEKELDIKTILIGCEGGFHEDEVSLFAPKDILGFDTNIVLKSESAICAVSSKLLL